MRNVGTTIEPRQDFKTRSTPLDLKNTVKTGVSGRRVAGYTRVVEGFNNKLKLITRKSYGFRTQNAYETALYNNLAALPEPDFTHRFF